MGLTEWAEPDTYGRYETLFRIASGGMAEVYAARVRGEAGFEKLVALKRMLPHIADDDRFVTMFMDEGRLAANISSPNVVSTLDLGRAEDGSLYLVMELVVGTTLSELLRHSAERGESIPVDVAVELVAQAANGLHDAHEARTPAGVPLRIVHRDISPQNVLVGVDGRVRITDFGVARAIMRHTKTSTGEFKGKLSYFSPEQCADRDLDQRSDIFSLGVVAWETLTTRRLFHAENPLAVLDRVTRMPIPSAHVVNPAVPHAVAAVVATALERDRESRFSTAAELAQALRAAARDTVGLCDRARVGELVSHLGGEGLARMQAKLAESLARPSELPLPPLEGAKTEISSGIVFRNDGGAMVPATPPAPVASAPAARETRAPSRLPFVVAGVVITIAVAAGTALGVVLVTSNKREAEQRDIGVLPIEGAPTSTPPPAMPAVQQPVVAVEPSAPAPMPEPAVDEPAVDPAPARPAHTAARARPPRHAPSVATAGPRDPRSSRGSRADTSPVARPATSAPRRTGGIVGVDDFDRDVGQR